MFNGIELARLSGTTQVWVGNGIYRRKVATSQEVTDIAYRITQGGGNGAVQDVARIDFLGVEQPPTDTTEVKQYVAQQVVAALTGVNGHILSDGDVDSIAAGVLDRMSLRLTQ